MPRKTAIGKGRQLNAGAGGNNGHADIVDEQGFLAGTVECAEFWRSVKKAVVVDSPDRQTCLRWGTTILKAWKNAGKQEQDVRAEEEKRELIENDLVMELFYLSVLTKRPLSQRFTWITDAFLEVEKRSKKMKAMLFRCTMPVIWRNLEAPNEDVRLAVCTLILKFFPLESDNEFIREEYIVRQQQAMSSMLMDNCVPIRVMAIKKVPEHLSVHWDVAPKFPRELIKSMLETLVDQLSLDSVAEVRAAVYEGFEHLLPCAPALNSTHQALKIITKRGINDKSERVRLAAFKMLNKLHGHRFIKLSDVLTLPECLRRLDFEHSAQIQAQIVRLLYRPFCPRRVEGIDWLERFKRIYFMCKESRQAALHFHRLVFTLELMSVQRSVQHIRSLLLGVKMLLRKVSGTENTADDTADTTLCLNISGASTMLTEQLAGEPDEKLHFTKDVLDSAIVLWMSIRYDLFLPQNAKENQEVNKIMSNLLQTLDNFTTTPLMDSALVIAGHLPKDKIGRLFNRIRTKLQTEEAGNIYFPHYVEALAAWDMNKLIELTEKGLKRLRNAVVAVCESAQHHATPQRGRRQQRQQQQQTPSDLTSSSMSMTSLPSTIKSSSTRDSPQAKRARVAAAMEEGVALRQPLDLIRMLLSSPQTSACLINNFNVHLQGFFESLSIIRHNFGELLQTDGWETKFDARILISSYETFNIVALITKQIEQPRRNSQGEDPFINEVELGLAIQDRVFYNELKWFAGILNERTPSFPIIEMFLRCACLHLCASQLGALVLNEMGNMLIEIKNRLQVAYDARSPMLALKKCLEHLEEALESCEEREHAERTLARKVRPLQEFFEAEERENNTAPTVEEFEGEEGEEEAAGEIQEEEWKEGEDPE